MNESNIIVVITEIRIKRLRIKILLVYYFLKTKEKYKKNCHCIFEKITLKK